MNDQDRKLWEEHSKRVDERHSTLVTYLSTEFERINTHFSDLNGRTEDLEKEVAMEKTRTQIRTTTFGVIGGAVASGLIMLIVFLITG